jgi:hypothetical protein
LFFETLIALPEYRLEHREQAARLSDEATQAFAEGQVANANDDYYLLSVVLMATVMFFAGFCQYLSILSLRVCLLAMTAGLLVLALAHMLALPRL